MVPGEEEDRLVRGRGRDNDEWEFVVHPLHIPADTRVSTRRLISTTG